MHDSEQLDLEGVYDALDLLKQAAILTREVDLEGEAMALSRAGYGELTSCFPAVPAASRGQRRHCLAFCVQLPLTAVG